MRDFRDTVAFSRSSSRPDWLPDIAVVLASTVAFLTFVYRLWQFHPRIPIDYEGDGLSVLSAFRNMDLGQWYFDNRRLGYPFGQHLQDFPAVADGLNLAFAWFLVKVLGDPVLAFNLFYLSTFPIAAISGYFGARLLSTTRLGSILVGVLFAFVPYHTLHGPGHLFLSMYPIIPFAVAIPLREWLSVVRQPDLRESDSLSRPLLCLGIVAGLSGLYFAFFSAVILVVVGLAVLLSSSSLRLVRRFVISLAAMALVLGVQLVPILWFQYKHGPNVSVAKRGSFEVEYYSLRLIDLILPRPDHLIRFFGKYAGRNVSSYVPGEAANNLGVLAAVGLVLLVMTAILKHEWPNPPSQMTLLGRLSILVLVCACLGGVNQILASFGFTQIRVWSRWSIVLAFMGLCASASFIDRFVFKSRLSLSMRAFVLLVVMVVSILDTNRPINASVFRNNSVAWHNDENVIAALRSHFGDGARVLQLPILKFPEQGPVNSLSDYAQLRVNLHSRSLCWSFGVVSGRDNGRTARWQGLSLQNLLNEAREQGFDALWLELRAYGDGGKEIVGNLTTTLGQPVVVDSLRQVLVFDIRSDRSAQRDKC